MMMQGRHKAFWEQVLARAKDGEESKDIQRLARELPAISPRGLLLGEVPERQQTELRELSNSVMPYLQETPLEVADDVVSAVASVVLTVRSLLKRSLLSRSFSDFAAACEISSYWHLDVSDLQNGRGSADVAPWLRRELSAILHGFVIEARDMYAGQAVDMGLLNAQKLPSDANGYGQLADLLAAAADFVPRGALMLALSILRRMEAREFEALVADVRSPGEALLLQTSLSADEAISVALSLAPRNSHVLFEATRRGVARRAPDASAVQPSALAQCLSDLASNNVNAVLGIRAGRGTGEAFDYALGLAMKSMPAAAIDAVVRDIEVSEYNHAYSESERILAGLDASGAPEVTRQLCASVLRRYEELSELLWNKQDHMILTPLVTGTMPFIVRALSEVESNDVQLAERVDRALECVSRAQFEWASSSVQQTCRFLIALGELCLLGAAAASNGLTLSDSGCIKRLSEFLADPRMKLWFLQAPVEVGELLSPVRALICSSAPPTNASQSRSVPEGK